MGEHMRRFFTENEHLTLVSAASEEDRKILEQAEQKKYIKLQRAPNGVKCFTQEDLAQAKMWEEKGCLD